MATGDFIKGQLVSGVELRRVARARRRTYEVKKVPKADVEIVLSEGYSVEQEFKHHFRLVKPKEGWQRFEEEIWLLLWRFGFSELSGLGRLYINVGTRSRADDAAKWKQVDVFGRADDNAFIVECKYAETPSRRDLESAITMLAHFRERMRSAVRKHYGDRRIKVSFVIATRNVEWSEADLTEARDSNIHVWRDKDVDYLADLAKLYDLIGDAARYQLYAIMFGDQKVNALEGQKVAAIKGKAGPWTYYSFVATPEQLLKICHVHRRVGAYGLAGIEGISSTYQRMLKPSKLKAIDRFIEEGRFFPNSVIIGFERPPRFDLMSSRDLPFQYGILTLPKYYGSAWIIDGQHRLYGYAKTTRRKTVPIPVIAFHRLPVHEQAKLFVEINQNQTRVESNLLWDLAGDIYEGSEAESQREDLTISRSVKLVDEMGNSPLKGHIFIPSHGKRGKRRNVTMTTVCQSIKKNKLLSVDMFGRVELDQGGFERFVAERMAAFFRAVQSLYPEDWRKGDSGYLRSNNGVAALFIVLRQMLKYLNLQDKQALYTKSHPSDFETEVSILLMPAIDYLKESPEHPSEFRRRRGVAGQSESAFYLCQRIKDEFDDFPLPRIKLPELPKDRDKAKPENVDQLIKDTELALREVIMHMLKKAYGDAWYRKGLPGGVKSAIAKELESEFKKRPYRKDELARDPWRRFEFTGLGHLRDIIVYGENWSQFKDVFGTKVNVETHFTDYIDLRNAFRAHPREVDPVVWDKGRGAIRWIRKCLKL